ncbi:MAG: hypothetical protein JWN72_2514 [Thermoleophilia bacterium]|nr:hypothetical protein [Thermoleophilia bacterium]
MTMISPLAPRFFPGGGTQNQPLPHPGIVAGGCYGTHPTSWNPLALMAPPITTLPVPAINIPGPDITLPKLPIPPIVITLPSPDSPIQ